MKYVRFLEKKIRKKIAEKKLFLHVLLVVIQLKKKNKNVKFYSK